RDLCLLCAVQRYFGLRDGNRFFPLLQFPLCPWHLTRRGTKKEKQRCFYFRLVFIFFLVCSFGLGFFGKGKYFGLDGNPGAIYFFRHWYFVARRTGHYSI